MLTIVSSELKRALGHKKDFKMKNLLFIPILVSIISCSGKQEVDFLSIGLEEAFDVAKQENKLLMVDFFSKTCMPCVRLVNTVFKDFNNKELGE